MRIQVQNINKPEVINHSYASVYEGKNRTIVSYTNKPGYLPVNIDGFTDWELMSDIFGGETFFCFKFAYHSSIDQDDTYHDYEGIG